MDLRPSVVLVGFFPESRLLGTEQLLKWLDEGAEGNYLLWRDLSVTRMEGPVR